MGFHMPLPDGGWLQVDIGHRLPHRQQDLDIGEWRRHSRGTRPVAVFHRDLSEGRFALPVGAQLQRHTLGPRAGELEREKERDIDWAMPSCHATHCQPAGSALHTRPQKALSCRLFR